MSRENVESVRSSFEAYLRGDYAGAVSYLAPDVVYEVGQELPARGPDEVREKWQRWDEAWDRLETVAEEYIDAARVCGGHTPPGARDSGRAPIVRSPHFPRRQVRHKRDFNERQGPRSRRAVGVGDRGRRDGLPFRRCGVNASSEGRRGTRGFDHRA